jgi:AbrB family looped-hinge helix DNA binding protein
MGVFVTLSSKGQLVIPAEYRQKLGLEAGQRLELSIVEGRIVLDRVPGLDELSAMATAWAAESGAGPLLDPARYYREHPERRG